jgi:hypothetical protein
MLGVRCLLLFLCLAWQLLTSVHSEPGAVRVFPYQITFPQNNTAENCLSLCSSFGYPAAGMEFGDECCASSTASAKHLRRRLRRRLS